MDLSNRLSAGRDRSAVKEHHAENLLASQGGQQSYSHDAGEASLHRTRQSLAYPSFSSGQIVKHQETRLLHGHDNSTGDESQQVHASRSSSESDAIDASHTTTPILDPPSPSATASPAPAFPDWSSSDDEALMLAISSVSGRSWAEISQRAFPPSTISPITKKHSPEDCRSRWTILTQIQATRKRWNQEEDENLEKAVEKYGKNWVVVSVEMGNRSSNQCRERWLNHVSPDIKDGPITPDEGQLIEELYAELGPRWSEIRSYLPGRPDNAIKNWWYTKYGDKTKKLSSRTSKSRAPRASKKQKKLFFGRSEQDVSASTSHEEEEGVATTTQDEWVPEEEEEAQTDVLLIRSASQDGASLLPSASIPRRPGLYPSYLYPHSYAAPPTSTQHRYSPYSTPRSSDFITQSWGMPAPYSPSPSPSFPAYSQGLAPRAWTPLSVSTSSSSSSSLSSSSSTSLPMRQMSLSSSGKPTSPFPIVSLASQHEGAFTLPPMPSSHTTMPPPLRLRAMPVGNSGDPGLGISAVPASPGIIEVGQPARVAKTVPMHLGGHLHLHHRHGNMMQLPLNPFMSNNVPQNYQHANLRKEDSYLASTMPTPELQQYHANQSTRPDGQYAGSFGAGYTQSMPLPRLMSPYPQARDPKHAATQEGDDLRSWSSIPATSAVSSLDPSKMQEQFAGTRMQQFRQP